MKHFAKATQTLTVLATALTFALPATALDIQAPDLDPNPPLDLPGDIAPPQMGGGGGGGGGDNGGNGGGGNGGSVSHGGDDGYIANSAPNECPNGELVVAFEFDADGHPIPTSFSRTCVIRP